MSLIGIIGTQIAPWLGEWVIVGLADKLTEGAIRHFKRDEMALLLKQSIATAEAAQPKTGALFDRCHYDGYNGVKQFLEQFFQSGEVLKELQKPLHDKGKPDLAILIAAFKKSAQQHSEAKDYLLNSLPLWMETFVESYFAQVKGICFQVAKAQYLKQLARQVDDVKFVGIAVPGEEVEKQEVLAQIFVMPDVREKLSKNIDRTKRYIPYPDMGVSKGRGVWVQRPLLEDSHDNHAGSIFEGITGEQSGKQNMLQEEQRALAMRDRSAPRIPAQKVINLSQKKAVVLGAPGSGKTMLASYFALMLCETPQSDSTQIGLEADADYLPIVVRIRDWILSPKMGLLDYLRSNAKDSLACNELPAGFFEHWLDRGQALILLDGLDEVVDEAQRRKVAEQIETFLHQYQNNPAVITSRPAGYRKDFFNLDEFPHYTLESFDDKQVATFIDHWYDSRLKDDKAQAERRKADLQKAFARNERIKLLAKNPLLLTIITLIHRYQAELPRQRYKLYEKAVETLLTSWDSGKEIKLYEQVLRFLKPDDLLYILKKLAYWIHTQGSTGETEGGTLIDKDELLRQLQREIKTLKKCEAHEAKGEAERFIDFIQRRTGLLNEQGRDRYAFVHKTFQEYLTAEEIFDRADVEDDTKIILDHFRQHLHDQHWREVLLLLVSKLKGKKAQKAIQAVLDAGSEYEQWLQRDLLFAGWCLTEDPPELSVVAADWLGGILDRLVVLEVEKSARIGSKIRGEVEKILHCFGETTLERVSVEKLQAQEDRIDRFRLIEFQAALGQEAEAIDALLYLLKDEDSTVRERAVQLSYLVDSPSVVNVVLSLLGDESLVGWRASSFLSHYANNTKEVVNDLMSLLRDENSNVRFRALEALKQLSNKSEEVISGLLSLLHDKNSKVRSGVAEALGSVENPSEEVVNGLRSLLSDRDVGVLARVVEAFGRLGNPSEEVVNLSLSLLRYGDMNISWRLGTLLCREHANPMVINSLLFLLKDENWNVRYNAVQVLGRLENLNEEIVTGLLPLLKDEKSSIRYDVVTILIDSKNTSSDVENTLLSLLEDNNANIRCNAARLLIDKLGDRNSKVVSALLSIIDSEIFQSDHLYAARILNDFKIDSPEVINLWWSCLRDGDSNMRYIASQGLSHLAKTSDTICPEVVQWLEQNPNNDGIGSAIDCLWSICNATLRERG